MYSLVLALIVNIGGNNMSMDIEISYENKTPCEISARSMSERTVMINGQVARIKSAHCVRND